MTAISFVSFVRASKFVKLLNQGFLPNAKEIKYSIVIKKIRFQFTQIAFRSCIGLQTLWPHSGSNEAFDGGSYYLRPVPVITLEWLCFNNRRLLHDNEASTEKFPFHEISQAELC